MRCSRAGFPAGSLAQGGQQTVGRDSQSIGASHDPAVSSIVGSDQTNRSASAPAIEDTTLALLGSIFFSEDAGLELQTNS